MSKPHYRRTASGDTILMRDGIQNAMTRLGTSYDKGAQNRHSFSEIGESEVIAAYQSSWLARQIVETPVDDATSKWREWTGDQSQEIKEAERRWSVRAKVRDAQRRARLKGGAAILIGAGPEDLAEPMDPKEIRKGELFYLTVLDRTDLTTGVIETDPTSELFGRPRWYQMAPLNGTLQMIHPSRLALFSGHDRADRGGTSLNRYSQGWGLSVLQAVIEAVRHHDAVMASTSALVSDAKTDLMKIPGLRGLVQDPNYEDMLVKRMEVAQMLRSIHRREAIDADEELESTTYTFSGMGDVIDRFMQVAAAAADIPMTRLFGQSPAGMNSTGEGDLANYYDQIASMQRNVISPAIYALDEVLIRSTIGDRPDGLSYEWAPLKQMSELQLAEVANKKAEALTKLNDLEIFDLDEMQIAAAAQFAELGFAAETEADNG